MFFLLHFITYEMLLNVLLRLKLRIFFWFRSGTEDSERFRNREICYIHSHMCLSFESFFCTDAQITKINILHQNIPFEVVFVSSFFRE